MSFIDHLEELRWHLIRSVIAIVIAESFIFIYVREIVDQDIICPYPEFHFITYKWLCDLSQAIGTWRCICMKGLKQNFLSNTDDRPVHFSFTIAFVGGFIVAFPYIFWEFWRFVKPALSEKE